MWRGEQRAEGDVLQAGGGLRQAGPRLKQQGHCGRTGNAQSRAFLPLFDLLNKNRVHLFVPVLPVLDVPDLAYRCTRCLGRIYFFI